MARGVAWPVRGGPVATRPVARGYAAVARGYAAVARGAWSGGPWPVAPWPRGAVRPWLRGPCHSAWPVPLPVATPMAHILRDTTGGGAMPNCRSREGPNELREGRFQRAGHSAKLERGRHGASDGSRSDQVPPSTAPTGKPRYLGGRRTMRWSGAAGGVSGAAGVIENGRRLTTRAAPLPAGRATPRRPRRHSATPRRPRRHSPPAVPPLPARRAATPRRAPPDEP